MKGTLTFDLPEDQGDFAIASHAMDWALVVFALDQRLRSIAKYGEKGYDSEEASNIRKILHDILDEYNLTLDMIA